MFFVCGIHGVGKTEYCRELAVKKGVSTFSASQLIDKVEKKSYYKKRVSEISKNQEILVEQVKKLREETGDFILDGHMCLMNQKGNIEFIDERIFRALNIECIEVLVDNPRNICERLSLRDGDSWGEKQIEKFQDSEVSYAKKIAKSLEIDFRIIKQLDKNKRNDFGKNIILPIKPKFVEKILDGEKKYEYRKQICLKNIDKIYLYATSPVMAIVGEADVLEKTTMRKEKLWDMSREQSGISKEYFDDYFCKSEMASAYRLGNTRRYHRPIKLNEVGITFIPQSYVYVENLRALN